MQLQPRGKTYFLPTRNNSMYTKTNLETFNQGQDCHGKSSIQQEEDSPHQQIRLRANEETSEVLHLEHSFVWCGNLDSSEIRSEVSGKF
jgi:hypothetical protein